MPAQPPTSLMLQIVQNRVTIVHLKTRLYQHAPIALSWSPVPFFSHNILYILNVKDMILI